MYTVLAIDDDKTTLGILESQLKALGYRVISEISPVKGVELAKEFLPDVILLDLNMPVMNGFQVMQSLQKEKLTKEVPVVIFTVDKDSRTIAAALSSGAIDYISKPYDPNNLGVKIKSAVKYGINRKLQNFDEFIEVSRRGEIPVITMRKDIREKGFQDAVKTVFDTLFIKQANGKTCVFDIREMNDFNDDNVRELVKILSMFSESVIKIVTGKHYGELVSSPDMDERVELFLSLGDLDNAMGMA